MKFTQKIVIAIALVASVILASAAYLNTAKTQEGGLIAVTSDAFGGPYTLTDQNGKTVTEKDFSGRYQLMYFGFTYCPAICPTELQKITSALNQIGPDNAARIIPIFITVDPERDTVETMKSYVSMFHPSLVGLTGTTAQIDAVRKEYKIYAAKRQDPSMSDYTMDHSSLIYFLAPDGRLLRVFKGEDTAVIIAKEIQEWLAQDAQ